MAQMQGVMASSEGHAEAMIAESESAYAAETQPVSTIGALPLTVISHGQLDVNTVPPSLDQHVRDDYEAAWQKLQTEITSLSTRGRRIVAERSGHNIIVDQPEIVIESVLEMMGTIRNDDPLFIAKEEMSLFKLVERMINAPFDYWD